MDSIFKKNIITKQEESLKHDQTFIDYIKTLSKTKLNSKGEDWVKTKELSKRVGIRYDMFRKVLNKSKPNQPRDFIIAICAALFLSEMETNKALFYYDDLPRLDDTVGCRDYYIIQTLEGNLGREHDKDFINKGVEEVNKTLVNYGFSPLRLRNKDKSKEQDIKPDNEPKARVIDTKTIIRSIRFEYLSSLCDTYHPYQYQARTEMYIEGVKGEKYILGVDNIQNEFKILTNREPYFHIVDKTKNEYNDFLNSLTDSNLRELRNCYEIVYDTRNFNTRESAVYKDGKIIFFAETFNYSQPEKNEYFYGVLIDGNFSFAISKKSNFMRDYLSDEDFKKYFPHKSLKKDFEIQAIKSVEEVQKYCERKYFNNPNEQYIYINYFEKIRKNLDKLKEDLKNGKKFIRDFDDYFDPDEIWTIYERYNLSEKFECVEREKTWPEYKVHDPFAKEYGIIDDDREIGECLGCYVEKWFEPQKESAEFDFNGQKVVLKYDDLKFAFELGINKVDEILKLKMKHPDLTEVIKNI